MEAFSTTIVVFWIFAILCHFASLAFVVLDSDSKEEFKWVWIIITLIIGPFALIPYWFWGREH